MLEYTNIQNDIENIEDLLNGDTLGELFLEYDITEEEYNSIRNKEREPTKQNLEDIYNFAYSRGLYLNEIAWQESLDEYINENNVVTCHGSRTYIKGHIRLDMSDESNDFANGFYMGQSISQGAMFVSEYPDSSLYILTFDDTGLKKAYFNVSTDWMLAVCWYRGKIPQYANTERIKRIQKYVDNSDYVLAPIADNKMFEVIDAFANKEITDLQCLYALSATHLGYQYVLKTEKCLDNLEIKKHLYLCSVQKSNYNKMADVETNTSMYKAMIAKKRYLNSGITIDELLTR